MPELLLLLLLLVLTISLLKKVGSGNDLPAAAHNVGGRIEEIFSTDCMCYYYGSSLI